MERVVLRRCEYIPGTKTVIVPGTIMGKASMEAGIHTWKVSMAGHHWTIHLSISSGQGATARGTGFHWVARELRVLSVMIPSRAKHKLMSK